MNDGRASRGCPLARVCTALEGTTHLVSSRHARKPGSCSTRTCVCVSGMSRVTHVGKKKRRPCRRRERENKEERGVGGQLSTRAGRNFKFKHPLSIKNVPFPVGTASMPCCFYTNFINHASRHTPEVVVILPDLPARPIFLRTK